MYDRAIQSMHIMHIDFLGNTAPTGIIAYHVKGNTIHNALHIDFSKSKLAPLSHSELKCLRSKYISLKFIFYEEVSRLGKRLFNKSNQGLQICVQIMGAKDKTFWRSTCHCFRRSLSNGTCKRPIHVQK